MIFKLDEEKKFLIIVFILALIIRLIVFIETGDHNADGMYRKMLVINWLKDPHFITGGLWPPLDIYLMAFTAQLWNDPIISTRLASLILGTIIVFPYYFLVKLLFDKRIAMISTLVLIFLSIHVQYSTLSMSEVPFVFFLFTSLYFFFRFKKGEKKMANLIISAIFLNLASMTRYEGWLFIPLLTIFTLNNINDIKKIMYRNDITTYFFTFLTVSLIFPVFWMIGNYNLHGDFFYGQPWSDNWIKTNIMLKPELSWLNPPFIIRLLLWPREILLILNVTAIFAALGLLASIFKKKNLEFLSIFLILMLIFTYKLVNSTMMAQSRHIIMPILFLIPYFTIGLDYSLKYLDRYVDNKFLNKDLSKIITVIVISFFIIISSYTAVAKNPYITPDYVFDISNWLKNNVKPGEKILLDEYNWWSLHILMYGGFNTTFTEDYLKTFEFATDQARIVAGGGKKIDDTTVISYLKDKPTYLVYSPKGRLAKVLNFSTKCQNETIFNYSFECKYTTENYNIYKLK